jgi:hypothetical protein
MTITNNMAFNDFTNNTTEYYFMDVMASQNVRATRSGGSAPSYTIQQSDFLANSQKLTNAITYSWLYGQYSLVTIDQFAKSYTDLSTMLQAGSEEFNRKMEKVASTLLREEANQPLFYHYLLSEEKDVTKDNFKWIKSEDKKIFSIKK